VVRPGRARVSRSGRTDLVVPDHFRTVLGHLPTGVTVITAHHARGPVGMSANSVTSVSLEPPLLLVCPARTSQTWPLIREAGGFCVNVLAEQHADCCRRFSMRNIDRFAELAWHERHRGPGIDDAVAWIECEIREEHDAGDHTIAVSEVVGLELSEETQPLVFFRGSYGTFAPAGGAAPTRP
jgi:3-hydroxy-9,10-secoandrosta-1,3,5(10)-triene-9,17-dione monooxygenase reductase component